MPLYHCVLSLIFPHISFFRCLGKAVLCITKTSLFKHTEHFTTKKKKKKISDKNSDIFQISAQNIDRGYSLEPSRRGVSNEYPASMFLS